MIDVVLESVTKRFNDCTAVDAVSLQIKAGELFFLLGPSGCGKTTLLRCIAGFWHPDAGRILFGGNDVTEVAPHRRNTGMVFQNYALWPHMSVGENVAFGLKVRSVARAERQRRVAEALDTVQMSAYVSRKPNELSGGQQQRIALARALVIEPQCVLLDEPLSNLDAKLRLEMRVEIRAICKRAGLTAIYVTHDQKEALSIADRIAVMKDGRVEQVGRPQELYNRPLNRFVADFLGETNVLDGEVVEVDDVSVRIRSRLGMVDARGGPGCWKQGDRVIVSIRPESIRPADGGNRSVNVFRGRIVETVYLGEIAQHQVHLGGEVGFKVTEINPKIDPTGEIEWWFDPADVTVLDA